ncbi:MAG TPA: FG-GAP-like repeat-containing protein [Lacunisphaera sp.]|jgi:hypothetical protein
MSLLFCWTGTKGWSAGREGLVDDPLAAKSGPRGATMFREMSPQETGVITENNYADPRMWTDHYQELVYGAIGTGVAVGDFDNDGRPDIFVVSKTEGCRLFRNLGNWKFEDVTIKAGLGSSAGMLDSGLAWMKNKLGSGDVAGSDAEHWKQGATFADVNNDGWLDIYVCRFGAPNLLYINQHDGTFKEEAAARGVAVVDACGMAAFCDYDHDGWLDFYLQTNMYDVTKSPTGQRDYLFHNNGDGTFTNVTDRAGITGVHQGHSATWWDYDNDGWPDLYIANDFAPLDMLYHNNRDGTFTDVISQVVPHAPYSAMGSDLGDLNNDGLIDFFVADMAATSHEGDQRGMAKIRALPRDNHAEGRVVPQDLRNALYLNTGTGHMLEAACLAGLQATDWTWSVRMEDLDNDGRLDLQFTNGMTREFQNADFLDRIMGLENPLESRLAVKNSAVFSQENLAYRNLGDLKFESVGKAWGLDQKGVSFGAAFGDFDGDGDLDLVYANYEHGVTLLRNDSDTGHRLIVALRGTQSNRFGVGATVRIETKSGRQVRQLVLARGYLSSSEPILHFGLGDDTQIKTLTVSWPGGKTQTFTDLAVDRKLTITEPAGDRARSATEVAGTGSVARPAEFTEVSVATNFSLPVRERPGEDINAQALMSMRQNRRGPAIAVGDITGAGVEDVIVGGTTLDPLRILLGSGGTAPFTASGASALTDGGSLDDGPVLLFDADGDGAVDLLVTKSGANRPAGSADYQPRLFLNSGHGAFHPAAPDALPSLPISVGALAAVDFNRDGSLDIFIGGRVQPGRYPLPPRSALLVNHGGKFEDATDLLAPGLSSVGLVTSVLWTDVDNDGWPDLLIALEWDGIRYWHNNQGHGFEDRSEQAGFAAAGTGWWTSLAAADFNGDGRLDYVAGNVGLNTQYRASAERPALLYYGNFNVGGLPQLVEAYYEGDKIYPWRSRNELAAKIPAVLKRFPKNDLYAKATLDEIVGADKLAAAKKFAATEFQSGVFLSQPDGTYRFEALPRMAQIAPLQGIVAGDFDGDGRADIYAVQNSFAPVPSVGHFDGGLSQLLRGDGHGHFTLAPPAESGLVVPGDAKALAVIDLDHDGWPDFLVSRNNNTTLAFRNNGAAGRHALRIALRGPNGNPTAIGARVTLELSDGSIQLAEVRAGSGYFSQSSPACFFGWSDGNPPKKIRVRWPDGKITERAMPENTTSLLLSFFES